MKRTSALNIFLFLLIAICGSILITGHVDARKRNRFMVKLDSIHTVVDRVQSELRANEKIEIMLKRMSDSLLRSKAERASSNNLVIEKNTLIILATIIGFLFLVIFLLLLMIWKKIWKTSRTKI
jgi:type III secretory pathway lipoprotein EscJ